MLTKQEQLEALSDELDVEKARFEFWAEVFKIRLGTVGGSVEDDANIADDALVQYDKRAAEYAQRRNAILIKATTIATGGNVT